MTVCTDGPPPPPRHPVPFYLFVVFSLRQYFFSVFPSLFFFLRHRRENLPPNRDRRHCDFVGVFRPKIVRACTVRYDTRLPGYRPSRVAPFACRFYLPIFRAEPRQQRKCVEVRQRRCRPLFIQQRSVISTRHLYQ